MSKQHILKIHPKPLADLLSGAKTCEIRFNDRGFQVGDTVQLQEIDPDTEQLTGRPDVARLITHIQQRYGLPDHLCVLSYAQPVAEPVAWVDVMPCDPKSGYYPPYQFHGLEKLETGKHYIYTAPPAAAHGDEAVRKDAERYRWLREDAFTYERSRRRFVAIEDFEVPPGDFADGAEAMDATIDAAMRTQAGEGGEV